MKMPQWGDELILGYSRDSRGTGVWAPAEGERWAAKGTGNHRRVLNSAVQIAS